ncbi:GNAT family N-acetyltransferase [Pseudomonas protegens]|nr:GNAT family N-acetyltransferase [Pseudomonas protegens]
MFLVAILDGVIIGTILAGYDVYRGWFYSVVVHPSSRKKDIGSALVRYAEQALIKRGCMKINLQIMSNNESVSEFYPSLGYAAEQRVSMGKRIPENIPGA